MEFAAMSSRRQACRSLIVLICLAFASRSPLPAAERPSVERILNAFHPIQKDVEYETPPPEDFSKCRVSVERSGKSSGWVVFGPNGQVLRRFVDTDGDNVVDQWRYYNHGLEVYREIDTDHDKKPDQFRWMNTGGSRWGLDPNEDGRIDSWKSLSPEEAVRLAVLAIVRQDEKLLQTLLVTRDDLQTLGIADSYATKIMDAVAEAGRKMRDIQAGSKVLTAQTTWLRPDNLTPCAIPAEEKKVRDDLVVYENAMAIVETQGKTGLVQIGELVRVGDVWKLTQMPQPIEGSTTQVMAGGVLMQPTLAASVASLPDSSPPSPEVQKILGELQKLDQASPAPSAGAEKLTEYNARRADILSRLVSAAATADERNQWMRQMVDSIASAVQLGTYNEGMGRLKSLESDLRRSSPNSPIVPYVAYRRLLADYTTQHQSANSAKQQETQKWWRTELEKFTKEFPNSEDAPEAMLQLGIAHEFIGQLPQAKHWYAELAERHPQTKPGRRAAGALRRLDLKGKPLDFSGPSLANGPPIDVRNYRGKVLLIQFWATWCTACTEDVPVLRELMERYHDRGFEIVGVDLDVTDAAVRPYLKQHEISWPQVFQPGGTESDPAAAFGIIVPPVMILVDRHGKVAAVTTTVDEIKTLLPSLIADKKAD
jgi:thiol-disulfide isomerase/thioredoxin